MIKFNSKGELLKRVEPALLAKEADLKRKKITIINKDIILNSLINQKWKKAIDLSLSEMVDDILYYDEFLLNKYF